MPRVTACLRRAHAAAAHVDDGPQHSFPVTQSLPARGAAHLHPPPHRQDPPNLPALLTASSSREPALIAPSPASPGTDSGCSGSECQTGSGENLLGEPRYVGEGEWGGGGPVWPDSVVACSHLVWATVPQVARAAAHRAGAAPLGSPGVHVAAEGARRTRRPVFDFCGCWKLSCVWGMNSVVFSVESSEERMAGMNKQSSVCTRHSFATRGSHFCGSRRVWLGGPPK